MKKTSKMVRITERTKSGQSFCYERALFQNETGDFFVPVSGGVFIPICNFTNLGDSVEIIETEVV